ncbi:MAG: hypothetical protein FJ012_09500 [Chloroflexi bacterium]|nr:hypothetical protein [Chloroflexota bacterium]
MGEIKSAWEIALEKVERLGSLSPEERRQQKEKEFSSIGQILAGKYLAGLGLWQLETELDKYRAEEKGLVQKSLASNLIQTIELGNRDRLQRVTEAILALKQGDSAITSIRSEIEQLFQEYEEEAQKESREIDKSAREVLHQLRISGSAIGAINPGVLPELRQNLNRLAQPYEERLEGLKTKLIDLSWVAESAN